MDTDVDQRAVERAGGADDIADGDRGDDAGDIAEHIEQTAGETANLFRRGIRHHRPAEGADPFAEEGHCHKADHHPLHVDIVTHQHGHGEQHPQHNRRFARNVQRAGAAH